VSVQPATAKPETRLRQHPRAWVLRFWCSRPRRLDNISACLKWCSQGAQQPETTPTNHPQGWAGLPAAIKTTGCDKRQERQAPHNDVYKAGYIASGCDN